MCKVKSDAEMNVRNDFMSSIAPSVRVLGLCKKLRRHSSLGTAAVTRRSTTLSGIFTRKRRRSDYRITAHLEERNEGQVPELSKSAKEAGPARPPSHRARLRCTSLLTSSVLFISWGQLGQDTNRVDSELGRGR